MISNKNFNSLEDNREEGKTQCGMGLMITVVHKEEKHLPFCRKWILNSLILTKKHIWRQYLVNRKKILWKNIYIRYYS